jgi:hypothetical protein
MRAAYLNQAINLVVGLLMVPMLLRYLSLSEYILWSIFTAFGGVTLQIESSIQVISVRELARQYHAGDAAGMQRAVQRARKAYRMLSAGVLVPFFATGALYLAFFASDKIDGRWAPEWLVFTVAYAMNYFFGANNSILLALDRVYVYNYVNSFTRALNFIGMLVLLKAGFAVLGLSTSFALSVLVGCMIIATVARRTLRAGMTNGTASSPARAATSPARGTAAADLVQYTVFTFFAYALYKGGVLVATAFFPKELVGPYSLTLQAFTMLSALALVPIQIWLASLVRALVANDREGVIRELSRTFLYTNLVFVVGTGGLLLFGNTLLRHLGAHVILPGSADLLVVAAAFLVEVNLFVLVNLLVTKGRYEFVKIYVPCIATGLALALCSVWLTQQLILSLIVVPAAVQVAVCTPLIIRLVSAEMKFTPAALITLLYQGMWVRN